MTRLFLAGLLTAILIFVGVRPVSAEGEAVAVSTGVDLYNRYVWRGMDIANTPSIQPAIAVGYAGFEFGGWGAYTLSNQASESDEIDFWLSYTGEFHSGATLALLATDYYFPNAGIRFFNFNDHDAVKGDTIPDPGAHTIELGLSFSGPESFPVTVSGYVNVYNEPGDNTYFQIDYPVTVGNTELGFFCGATGGSKDNPDYYGSENFEVINVGVAATRAIEFSESLQVPLSVSLIVNPRKEISYLLVGMSF